MNMRNLPMAFVQSASQIGVAAAHVTKGASVYVITKNADGSADLSIRANSQRLGAVAIPAGTYDTVEELLAAYPEIANVFTWQPGYPRKAR